MIYRDDDSLKILNYYILMEYAPNGNLDAKISKQQLTLPKFKRENFTDKVFFFE